MEGLGIVNVLVNVVLIYSVSVIFDTDDVWFLHHLITHLFPSAHLYIYGNNGMGGLGIFSKFFQENNCRRN